MAARLACPGCAGERRCTALTSGIGTTRNEAVDDRLRERRARIAQSVPEAVGGLAGPVAGWVLARFIELDLPGPVKDYASSADLHVVAWFELNRVPDGSGGEVPQYLVAGSHGGEGGACDFTMLRVYTWGKARKRYETAYTTRKATQCGPPAHSAFPVVQKVRNSNFPMWTKAAPKERMPWSRRPYDALKMPPRPRLALAIDFPGNAKSPRLAFFAAPIRRLAFPGFNQHSWPPPL